MECAIGQVHGHTAASVFCSINASESHHSFVLCPVNGFVDSCIAIRRSSPGASS